MFVPRKTLEDKLKQILTEDIGLGDITSAAVVPAGLQAEAEVLAKEAGITAGIEEVTILAESLGLHVKTEVADGDEIKRETRIMRISGDAQTILTAERTMLNLLSRMSGIATTTRKLTGILKKANSKARIAATRKTAPGLLYFDKKAVLIGGGDPHRLHLDDMILLKDNHVSIVGDVETAVRRAKQKASFSKKIEVEVTKVADVPRAAEAGADIIMLDNFSPRQASRAIELLKKSNPSVSKSQAIIGSNLFSKRICLNWKSEDTRMNL